MNLVRNSLLSSLLSFLFVFVLASGKDCPEKCSCDAGFVICKVVDEIPKGFPPGTSSLALPGCGAFSIDHDNFISIEESIEELDISNSSLEKISPGTFTGMRRLESLDLTNTNLTEIHVDMFAGLENLQSLDLSSINLKVLRDSPFRALESLRRLDLRGNDNLVAISRDAFSGLEYLEELFIGTKKLRYAPSKFLGVLGSVDHIILEDFPLASLQIGYFPTLPSLRQLCLDRWENLEDIGAMAFETLTNLTELSITSASLEGVPSLSLANLPKLQKLKLDNNPGIRTLRLNDFAALLNLRELSLVNVGLHHVISEAPFHSNEHLISLDLSQNHLEAIPTHTLFGLYELERLNISSNNLTTLLTNTFETNRQLHEVDVSKNPIICDCDLMWLKIWHSYHLLDREIHGKCSSPKSHSGIDITAMEHKFFVCTPPRFTVHNLTISSPIDKKLTLDCVPDEGSPDPTVNWSDFEGRDLPTYEEMLQLRPAPHIWQLANGSLVFNTTKSKDFGIYRCTATNKEGASIKTFKLKQKKEDEVNDIETISPPSSGDSTTAAILIIIGLALPIVGAAWYLRKRRLYRNLSDDKMKWNAM